MIIDDIVIFNNSIERNIIMGKSVAYKILENHLISGNLVPGEEIEISIDQTLTQDATGTMAYLQFEAMGIERVATELSVSYVDHNTVQVGFENSDDHRYLQTVADRYGIVFSPPGNGICHQLHLERFGIPGKTLIGSDSHTPTGGGLCMFSMGAGGIDVAVAMGGGGFFITAPRVIEIRLEGKLRNGVSPKDIILEVLRHFGTKGNVGTVFEYTGSGLAHLDVPDRATITNMGAECGVTTSLFPSDEKTKKFLEAQGRGEAWSEIIADKDASYDKTITIDLSTLEPLSSAPHSPGNIVPISELEGMKVDQVLIGSCTNSSYRDLRMVGEILRGRKVKSGVSLGVAPGSRQVLQMITSEGYLSDIIGAGGRLLESACGFCIGNHMSPGTNAISLRTSNRNFEGRSGTLSAQVYLVSPEVAAIAAITGVFSNPLTAVDENGNSYLPKNPISMPEKFLLDDSMFIQPSINPNVEILRGPNIGNPPESAPLVESMNGVATIKVGDNITTDHIMPAGARLKYRSNIPKYAEFVFESVDGEFFTRSSDYRDNNLANMIVAGESYGQGSSREHAALCPRYLGVQAVVAKSIERIHMANLFNFGIIPLIFKNPADYTNIQQGDSLEIPSLREQIADGATEVELLNKTSGVSITLSTDFTQRQRDLLLAGGLLLYTKQQG